MKYVLTCSDILLDNAAAHHPSVMSFMLDSAMKYVLVVECHNTEAKLCHPPDAAATCAQAKMCPGEATPDKESAKGSIHP